MYGAGLGGCFGDWSSGISETWQAKRDKPRSWAERAAFAGQVKAAKKQAEADLIARHAEAANRATRIWSAATGAPRSHPYLLRKRIQPHGARSYKGTLVLPVTTFADKLTSLQFISSAGRKSKRIFRTSPCSRRSGHRMPRRNGWAH